MPVVPSDPQNFPAATSSRDDRGTSSSEQTGKETKKATAVDHLSKGPAIPENMPPKASREEVEARMKELNQK